MLLLFETSSLLSHCENKWPDTYDNDFKSKTRKVGSVTSHNIIITDAQRWNFCLTVISFNSSSKWVNRLIFAGYSWPRRSHCTRRKYRRRFVPNSRITNTIIYATFRCRVVDGQVTSADTVEDEADWDTWDNKSTDPKRLEKLNATEVEIIRKDVLEKINKYRNHHDLPSLNVNNKVNEHEYLTICIHSNL